MPPVVGRTVAGAALTLLFWLGVAISQFFFASRLPGEPAEGVGDIHFTPGTPRSFLGGLALRF
jgi:hypothetical protein